MARLALPPRIFINGGLFKDALRTIPLTNQSTKGVQQILIKIIHVRGLNRSLDILKLFSYNLATNTNYLALIVLDIYQVLV